MDIQMDLEFLELELGMDLNRKFQLVMAMEMIHNNSIHNSYRLRMQLQLML